MESHELSRNDNQYDFFSFKKWLVFLGGYMQSKKWTYQVYRIVLVLLVSALTALSIYGAILVPDKRFKIDALHYSFVGIHTVYILGARFLTRKSLNKAKLSIQAGIYTYEEDSSQEEESIRAEIPVEIRKKIRFFLIPSVCGITSNQVLFPLSQLLLLKDEDYEKSAADWMNPYLPHVLYMPFSTRSPFGYWAAYLLDCLAFFSLYIVTYSMFLIYINLTTQVKIHFKVLDHSITNIQKRAYQMYRLKNDAVFHREDLFNSRAFQCCLHECLKSNIKHHQALLRFRKQFQPYIGAVLMVGFTIAAMVYACNIYLILQKPKSNVLVNYVLSLMADWLYAYQLCVFGEEVIQQSSQIFQSIYNIPWLNYGREFNQTLLIMMSNVIKPVRIDATLFRIPASLETYGTLLSTMYKMVSIVRQSDVVH